jgi:general secretion pathway protein N
MIKPGQAVFIALASGCVVLIAGAGLLLGGVGLEVAALDPMERNPGAEQHDQADLDSFRLAPLEEYAGIVQRPLFNDDRLPRVVETSDDDDGESDDDLVAPVALNVTVNGIIITPELKVAMVTDNATKEKLRLRENMPLEGDQGAWVLQRIEPRKLVFEGGGDGPAEVELVTHTKALKAGAASPARAKRNAGNKRQQNQPQNQATPDARQSAQASLVQERARQADNGNGQDDQERAAKAEEIRRRVAERRAQLREEAARRRAEEDDNG